MRTDDRMSGQPRLRGEFCAALTVLAVAAALVPGLAGAQSQVPSAPTAPSLVLPQSDVGRGETVRNRGRPDFDPLGQYFGGFLFFPLLEVEESFNSNIFADEDGEKSDFITRVLPGVRVNSDWGRHALAFEATADVGLHVENPDENYEDFRLGTGGRLDIIDGSYLSVDLSFQNLHESRGSPDDAAGENPTEYNIYSAGVEGFYPLGRFSFRLTSGFDRLDFDDIGAGAGLADIDSDDRDRNTYETSLKAAYEIQPGYQAFIRGTYNVRDFDDEVDRSGLDRDSNGIDVVAGMEVDFGGLVFGDFFAGYKRQEFQDSALSTIDGVSAGASIDWSVTPLTTINFGAGQAVEDSTIAGASGLNATTGSVRVDHELLRSLILSASASVSVSDYEGIDRTDTTYTGELQAKYFLNRYLFASGGYIYRTRESTVSGVDEYAQHIGLVRLGVQY